MSNSFPVQQAKLDLRETEFQENKNNWEPVLDKLDKALKTVSDEGNQSSIERHQGRGQLLR